MSTTGKSKTSSAPARQGTFGDHIGELRTRLVWIALVFMIASAVAYSFRDILVDVVLSPLGDQKLVYLTPAGGFAFIFQITMYAGAVVSAPLFIYHLYKFVQPALPGHATHRSLRVVVTATLLMLAGVFFGYFIAVPSALHFLTEFAGDFVTANLTADSYLNFIVAYVAGLGILFQLPLLLVFWNWISPLSPGKLLDSQRYMVAFSFIAAAMITPTPDVVNQAMIAGPILVVYQFGVIAVYFTNRKHRRATIKKQPETPTTETSGGPIFRPRRDAQFPVAAAPRRPLVLDVSAQPKVHKPRPSMKTAQVKAAKPIRAPHAVVRPAATIRPQPVTKPSPVAPMMPAIQAPKPAGDATKQSIDGLKSASAMPLPKPVRRPVSLTNTIRASGAPSRPVPQIKRQLPSRISLDGVSRV